MIFQSGNFMFLWVICFFLPLSIDAQNKNGSDLPELQWEIEKLADGVYWKSYLGDDLFDAKLSINILKMNPVTSGLSLKIAYREGELIKTSDFAAEHNALAAINGSFFHAEPGGSVVFLKVDGKIIVEGAVNRNPYIENGAIGWYDSGMPVILPKPDEGWLATDLENVLSSGPLLLYNNEFREFRDDPFNQNRHPRTAVAITEDNNLLMVTVDGRSFQSYGMTIPELAEFLKSLRAVDALNLDGGGSTSMWIENMKTDGIVNYPSDNFEFDHEGERGVSNALLILHNQN
ncbi:MAG: phosphodiester glycosidase family protein [Balneolaceae bacterium]|nr:phosphodiester glycosidase family protein [Balneolaceae bacterium]